MYLRDCTLETNTAAKRKVDAVQLKHQKGCIYFLVWRYFWLKFNNDELRDELIKELQ
jgi:hypothetical protein